MESFQGLEDIPLLAPGHGSGSARGARREEEMAGGSLYTGWVSPEVTEVDGEAPRERHLVCAFRRRPGSRRQHPICLTAGLSVL